METQQDALALIEEGKGNAIVESIGGDQDPAMQFVLAACNADRDLQSGVPTTLDWTRVFALADHHDVMPAVCTQICSLHDAPLKGAALPRQQPRQDDIWAAP